MNWLRELFESINETLKDHATDVAVMIFISLTCITAYHFIVSPNNSAPAPVATEASAAPTSAAPAAQPPAAPTGPSEAAIKKYNKDLGAYNVCIAKQDKIRRTADMRWTGYQQMQERCETATNEGSQQRLCALAAKQRASFDQVAAQANFSCQQPVPPV